MAWRDKIANKAPDGFYDLMCPIGNADSFWKIYAPTPYDTRT